METDGAPTIEVPGSAEPLTPEQRAVRLQELRDWGVDLSLTEVNLSRTPSERVQAMLSALEFIDDLRTACRSATQGASIPARSQQRDSMNQSYWRLFERFSEEKVVAVVIGGVAAVALGADYVTRDLDLCFDPDHGNVENLARALAPLHPRLRPGGIKGLDDAQAQELPFRLDAQTLGASAILTLQTDVGPLDLMSEVPGVGLFSAVRSGSIEATIFGFQVLVLDLPALIASKRAAGRPKDLLALPQIEAVLRQRDERATS